MVSLFTSCVYSDVDFCLVGANELAVQKAKTEITRLIKEELIRLVSIVCLFFLNDYFYILYWHQGQV